MEQFITILVGLLGSLAAEYRSVISDWFKSLTPIQRLGVSVAYALAYGVGMYLYHAVRLGEGFSWQALGLAAWAALEAWLASQGGFGLLHARKQQALRKAAVDKFGPQ